MDKIEKAIYKVNITRYMKHFTTWLEGGEDGFAAKRLLEDAEKALGDIDGMSNFEIMCALHTAYIYEAYNLRENQNLNPKLKDYVIDIVNLFCSANILGEEDSYKAVNNILNVLINIKKVVPYEDFVYFSKRLYPQHIPQNVIRTNVRLILYLISTMYHKREILGVVNNKPVYQKNMEFLGGSFSNKLQLVAVSYAIFSNTPNVSGEKLRPKLLNVIFKEIDKMGFAEYKRNIEKNLALNIPRITAVIDNFSIEDYTFRRMFLNEDLIPMAPDIDLEVLSNFSYLGNEEVGGFTCLSKIISRDNVKLDTTLLMNRSFLIPEQGVRITLSPKYSELSWIEMREIHEEEIDRHMIFVTYSVGKHTQEEEYTREYLLNIEDIKGSMYQLQTELDFVSLFTVLEILGVGHIVRETVTSEEQLRDIVLDYELDEDIIVEEPNAEEMLEDFLNEAYQWTIATFDVFRNSITDCIFEVPRHWNYKGNTYGIKGTREGERIEITKLVHRFTRTLPIGHKPSQQAIDLAKRYKINLEENKTIVGEHTRTVKIKV